MWIAIAVLGWFHPVRWMQQHKWNESMDMTDGQKTEHSSTNNPATAATAAGAGAAGATAHRHHQRWNGGKSTSNGAMV